MLHKMVVYHALTNATISPPPPKYLNCGGYRVCTAGVREKGQKYVVGLSSTGCDYQDRKKRESRGLRFQWMESILVRLQRSQPIIRIKSLARQRMGIEITDDSHYIRNPILL